MSSVRAVACTAPDPVPVPGHLVVHTTRTGGIGCGAAHSSGSETHPARRLDALARHPRARRRRQAGTLELECQTLYADNEAQFLLVYTATPGSESAERLRLLDVIGPREASTPPAASGS